MHNLENLSVYAFCNIWTNTYIITEYFQDIRLKFATFYLYFWIYCSILLQPNKCYT